MDFVGNVSLFAEVKNFTNQSRIDKVIAMVRLAQFLTHSVDMMDCASLYMHAPPIHA